MNAADQADQIDEDRKMQESRLGVNFLGVEG
jgi:hypothetical protein